MSLPAFSSAEGDPLRTRAQWVDRRLRQGILSGELKPGERLLSAELAARWSVSPTPLREAFLRLEADGLVESEPHKGVRVTELTVASLHELYDVRLLLEPFALRRSMSLAQATNLAQVRAAHQRLVAVGHTAEPLVYEDAHVQFHHALLAACASPLLLSLTDTFSVRSSRYRVLSGEPRGGMAAVTAEHEALLGAFVDDDTDRAVELLGAHIGRTLDCAEALLPSSSAPSLNTDPEVTP